MEYFDMRKMSVNLWRNAAGETREICTFPPAKRDFSGVPALHPSRRMGSFFVSRHGKGSDVAGRRRMFLESADRFNHTLKPLQPFAFAADQVVKAN